ncbi:putative sigma-54 modulation protein [Clostridium collagenovorans DSM 3089]|uniref:Ribosome hibernation promoting factor n=1 Tax=Clostridium collagenovorans DSM 3089 TaxID=1121306 RepID=A0A1M5W1I8_9CLOT|nr:ribosome-associated translation inhibitor RaiA [Clostridium collagenovorans]SHH81372.1 putative sigma-54 modulation protein [Clostridium collagenovorans DSM 3089]
MKVKVIGRNVEVTKALKEIIEKKVSRLERYFKPEVEANVLLSVQKSTHTAEVTIPFNGVILRAEEANGDMYNSVDLVIEKIERQIRKQKTKMQRKIQGESLIYGLIPEEDSGDEKDGKIVKTKRFAIKPMATEEAILQMELLGHSFFVYMDDETSEVNVIYKRKDGNYGLIEPEFE